jgi:hypothetical protein
MEPDSSAVQAEVSSRDPINEQITSQVNINF